MFGIEKEDCYVCSDINPFLEGPNFPLHDKKSYDTFEAMMVGEEANERDSEISWTLNSCTDNLAEQVNEKEKWVSETMKNVKEA